MNRLFFVSSVVFLFLDLFFGIKIIEEICYIRFGLFNLRADAQNWILDYSIFFSRTVICFDVLK